MAPQETHEPADFEIRASRGILAQLVSGLNGCSEKVRLRIVANKIEQSLCEFFAQKSVLRYATLATQLDTSSMTPLPALVALRTTEPSYGTSTRAG